jgi:uncharacterized membrane protein YdcZ (DUF606 family)
VSGGSALAVTMSVVAGLAGAMQVAVMGRLGDRIGVPEALAWASLLSLGLAVAILVVARGGLRGFVAAAPARAAGIVLLAVGACLSLTRA